MKKYPIQIVTKRNGVVHQYQRYRLLSQKSITETKEGHDIFHESVNSSSIYNLIISTYSKTITPKTLNQAVNEGETV